MICRSFISLIVLLFLAVSPYAAVADDSPPRSIYLIGNSLTWDTVPSRLDEDVQWHVDCGKSLPYIFANPEAPCVKSSTLWPEALKKKQYDIVSVQTHYGATLQEDIDTIAKWMKMQPKATFVIHTGWAHHEKREGEYASTITDGNMQHSPAYIKALVAGLQKRFPERELRQTHAIDLLAQIAKDAAEGSAPIKDVSELHRDAIHVTLDNGRYLMHNAMRRALGQPPSSKGFEKVTPKMKAYLDGVLESLE